MKERRNYDFTRNRSYELVLKNPLSHHRATATYELLLSTYGASRKISHRVTSTV